jgi:hypothetical protein
MYFIIHGHRKRNYIFLIRGWREGGGASFDNCRLPIYLPALKSTVMGITLDVIGRQRVQPVHATPAVFLIHVEILLLPLDIRKNNTSKQKETRNADGNSMKQICIGQRVFEKQ